MVMIITVMITLLTVMFKLIEVMLTPIKELGVRLGLGSGLKDRIRMFTVGTRSGCLESGLVFFWFVQCVLELELVLGSRLGSFQN